MHSSWLRLTAALREGAAPPRVTLRAARGPKAGESTMADTGKLRELAEAELDQVAGGLRQV